MTLVFDDGTTPGQAARTHAFLLGVGHYTYIDPQHGTKPQLTRLQQLPEAWISARKIANWLITHAIELTPPLGTVELLASAPGHTSLLYNQHQLAAPVLTNTTAAYLDWERRLNMRDDNLAFFYYCGHGLLAGGTLLLLGDVSNNPNDPFVQAINFDRFWRGMQSCQAPTQLFFADSCQQIDHTIRNQLTGGSLGTSLTPGSVHKLTFRNALRVNAAAPGASAWASVGEATEFARALKRALIERGAEQQPSGRWAITLAGLANAIRKELDRAIRNGAPYQAAMPTTEGNAAVSIRDLAHDPIVPVEMILDPTLAIHDAELSLDHPRGTPIYHHHPPLADTMWRQDVAPDSYCARASVLDPRSNYYPRRGETPKFLCLPPRRDVTVSLWP